MKQMLLVLFTLAAIFSIEAADSIFRVNIDGRKSRIILSPEKDISSMKASTWSWIKDSEEKKFTLTATSGKKLSATQWQLYTLAFTPKQSGSISIHAYGEWAAAPENRAWLLLNQIELDHNLYPNGNFKAVYSHGERSIPRGFWLSNKAQYLPTAGENNSPAVLINHDNNLGFQMNVEAGKKYSLSFKVKAQP